ncbi:MAG: tyrosine-type recombinase/integrase [Burkholderiaceae bacterium]|nr:tyrosine-type recombinase/integrase [Burkholderiaceae bacterium]
MPFNLINSDTALRAMLKAIATGQKPAGRISDGAGLYLLPLVKGGATAWRFDYSFQGCRKTLSLGTYPATGLSLARQKAAEARELLAAGTDPSEVRKEARAAAARERAEQEEAQRREAAKLPPAGSLQAIAGEWLTHRASAWTRGTREKIAASLDRHVFPHIGRTPIGEITPGQVRECVQRIESAGAAEMAGRVFQRLRSVFRYAVAHEYIATDPTYPLKPAEILKPRTTQHRPALSAQDAPAFLRHLAGYGRDPMMRCALLFLVLTAVRPGELRGARWEEFDEAAGLWRIPGPRMKMKTEHLVPLSRQALEVLAELQPLTGSGPLLFPSPFYPSKPISANTLNSALARMGYKGEATAHGMRTLFSTCANEAGHRADVIERQLAHEERDGVRGAYNRAEYLPERRKLMDWWGARVDAMRSGGAQVLPLRSA